jgi:hypothetical protein
MTAWTTVRKGVAERCDETQKQENVHMIRVRVRTEVQNRTLPSLVAIQVHHD